MSTCVDPAYQNVQQSVNVQLRLAIVTPVVLSTMTYVESVSPRMSHKVPHVLVSVPVLLPLESATQAVTSLLVFVVLVFQHAQESVRMPFDLETVTPVVMPTLTFVENVSQSTPHLLQQQ